MSSNLVTTIAVRPLPEGLYHVPESLPGIDEIYAYRLHREPAMEPFYFLHAESKSDLTFVCIDPLWVKEDYFDGVRSLGKSVLGAYERGDARLACLVTLGEVPFHLSVNLQAPILFDLRKNEARQLACLNAAFPAKLDVTEQFRGYHRRGDAPFARAS